MAPSQETTADDRTDPDDLGASSTREARSRAERARPYETIPGPNGWATLQLLGRIIRGDITDGLAHLRDQYGPTARLNLLGSDVHGVVVSRPEHVEHVLETNQSNYCKPDPYFERLSHLGEGILTSEGDAWRDQHRLLMPMFQQDSVYGFTDLVVDQTERLLERWRSVAERGGTIDLLEEMSRLTLHIIGRAMFSTDMADHADEIRRATKALRNRIRRQQSPVPYPQWILDRRYQEPVDTLRSIATRLIQKRRGDEAEHEDLLTMMMLAEDEGTEMSDERIVDNIATFLLAGHDTTTLSLTWTWYLLARHPEPHRRLHETVADAPVVTDRTFTPEAVEDIRYARQALQEGMRLYPPVPFFPREPVEDDVIGDWTAPSGTQVLVSQFLTHRDPAIWEDPRDYRPERFHPDRSDDRPRYSYYPFGGGGRMCIGRQFSLMEAQLVLSLVAAELRLELESPQPDGGIDVSSAITMWPDTDLRMSVHEWAG